jgi:RimJ/RimL family protein N-acetyltransferase
MSNKRVIILKGKKVSLVVPEKEDISLWYHWINNPEIAKPIWQLHKIHTLEAEEKYYEKLVNGEFWISFSIMVNETKKIIWNIAFKDLSHFHKTSDLWLAIFDNNSRNKWYWTEVIRLFLDYAFRIQWLRKMCLTYWEFNKIWEHVYKKIWFKEAWVYKKHLYADWEYWDYFFMEIFKDEFYEINEKFL